jgi:hypothetical protein
MPATPIQFRTSRQFTSPTPPTSLRREFTVARIAPPPGNSHSMRAEAESLVESIKQSMGLLRRHL